MDQISTVEIQLFTGKSGKRFARMENHDDKNGSRCPNTTTTTENFIDPSHRQGKCLLCKQHVNFVSAGWHETDENILTVRNVTFKDYITNKKSPVAPVTPPEDWNVPVQSTTKPATNNRATRAASEQDHLYVVKYLVSQGADPKPAKANPKPAKANPKPAKANPKPAKANPKSNMQPLANLTKDYHRWVIDGNVYEMINGGVVFLNKAQHNEVDELPPIVKTTREYYLSI